MGYNIGLRIADDLLSKNANITRCTDMHQVADALSKTALRTYLGSFTLMIVFLPPSGIFHHVILLAFCFAVSQ